jgi:alcohol dehydrogenase class IV
MGFGNAGVHLPHGMSYPVSGHVKQYHAPGYPDDHPLIPHGMSVILTAPASFRFTYATSRERHLRAAELMGFPARDLSESEQRDALPRALAALMRDVGIPNGLTAVGYAQSDVPSLIAGTLKQPRLLSGAPRTVGAPELEGILEESMRIW